MACPKSTTSDGFESQFGINHLGHFYLTKLLLPTLIKTGTPEHPSRVVNLSSIAHFFSCKQGIWFDDIAGDVYYSSWERYGHSKFANVLFTKGLQSRYASQNVISIALHPGSIPGTELDRHLKFSTIMKLLGDIISPRKFMVLLRERSKTIPEGSATTLVAALDPKVEAGGYYYDCKASKGEAMHPLVSDAAMADRLWEMSEKMISEKL